MKRVPVRAMQRVQILGNTRTDAVVEEAKTWLLSQAEPRKVLAIFTDGLPDYPRACASEVLACKRFNIAVLVGALEGCSRSQLTATMPGAEIFCVGDNLASSFHQAITKILRFHRQ